MDDATQEDCKTKRVKQVKNQEITLLSAIEYIAISAKDSALCDLHYISSHNTHVNASVAM